MIKKIFAFLITVILVVSCVQVSKAQDVSKYKTNKNGETFGNDKQAQVLGYSPDLILAIGENGVTGYVKKTDLEENVSTPLDFIEKTEKKESRRIPVYTEDGMTIVDTFLLEHNDNIVEVTRDSDYSYGTLGGINVSGNYTCTTVSGIKDVAGGVKGLTRITTDRIVAERWLYVQVGIYKASNGALVQCTEFIENEEPARGFEVTKFHGTALYYTEYYAKGAVKTWNPSINEFWTTGTFPSPNITPDLF